PLCCVAGYGASDHRLTHPKRCILRISSGNGFVPTRRSTSLSTTLILGLCLNCKRFRCSFGGSTMFDRLFRMPHVLARLEDAQLAEDRRLYLFHCAHQRMAPHTLSDIARFTLRVAEALRLAERPGEIITRSEIETEAERWVNRLPKPRRTRNGRCLRVRFTGHAVRW